MSSAETTDDKADVERVSIPPELREGPDTASTVFVDTSGLDLSKDAHRAQAYGALKEALQRVHSGTVAGQTLVKVHVGEPKCGTRLSSKTARPVAEFLRGQGADSVVAGDTTVAYTGDRGHRKNPEGDVSVYRELARSHGWHADGEAGMPFVVLDRPCSGVEGQFEFDESRRRVELAGVERFDDFFPAGGFLAADMTVNLAHLTLHGLAGVAGCVKAVAMGCSSLKGKLRMHQSLLPEFDPELCLACGQCVKSCPEGALTLDDDADTPVVDPDLCIGCGECEAVCAAHSGAVSLQGEEIDDWERGRTSLPLRLVDYTMGLMQGRWADTVHVLSMTRGTERCDCLNVSQDPMIEDDMGFLVGKNPFAIDRLAGRMLAERLEEEGKDTSRWELKTAERSSDHAAKTYGFAKETPVETVDVSTELVQ